MVLGIVPERKRADNNERRQEVDGRMDGLTCEEGYADMARNSRSRNLKSCRWDFGSSSRPFRCRSRKICLQINEALNLKLFHQKIRVYLHGLSNRFGTVKLA